ncbi:unnamed protein product [Pleuronectes platessa]|uniref:Uncharacterized protein n=1 Tax=Pleuronectes platessa TaxID=8262 RepID=A0A9N7V1S2_PLEPL|nr:unnamed protein product [Pleuronectes platessa]
MHAKISQQKAAGGCHSHADKRLGTYSTDPRTAPVLHPAAPRTKQTQKAAQLCGITLTSCSLSLAQLKRLALFAGRRLKLPHWMGVPSWSQFTCTPEAVGRPSKCDRSGSGTAEISVMDGQPGSC